MRMETIRIYDAFARTLKISKDTILSAKQTKTIESGLKN